jgi:hypothetical protein
VYYEPGPEKVEMPILANPKHERFCQERASGAIGQLAYERAGFKASGNAAATNAGRLLKKAHIQMRIAELLAERETVHAQSTAKAIEAAALSKTFVIEKLMLNLERALQCEAVRDKDGNVVGDFKYEGSVANRALELLGKELGMFIDRKEIKNVDQFEDMDVQKLKAWIEDKRHELGMGNTADASLNWARTGVNGRKSNAT